MGNVIVPWWFFKIFFLNQKFQKNSFLNNKFVVEEDENILEIFWGICFQKRIFKMS
jgi:hypothetical protein